VGETVWIKSIKQNIDMRFLTLKEFNKIKLLLTLSSIGEVVMNSKQYDNFSVDTVKCVNKATSYEEYNSKYDEQTNEKDRKLSIETGYSNREYVIYGNIGISVQQILVDLKRLSEVVERIEAKL